MKISKGDAIAYASLITVAVLEALDPYLKDRSPKISDRYKYIFDAIEYLPIAILLAIAVILLARRYIGTRVDSEITDVRNLYFSENEWNKPLQMVFRRKFMNETIKVEGIEFVECEFKNVTLHYDGNRPFRFTNCRNEPDENGMRFKMTTANPVISQMIQFLSAYPVTTKILDIRPTDP